METQQDPTPQEIQDSKSIGKLAAKVAMDKIGRGPLTPQHVGLIVSVVLIEYGIAAPPTMGASCMLATKIVMAQDAPPA